MRDAIIENLAIFCISYRCQIAILTGITFSLGFFVFGNWYLNDFHLEGHMEPAGEKIKHIFERRYDKVSLTIFIAFMVLAYKLFKKDKKRFYQH